MGKDCVDGCIVAGQHRGYAGLARRWCWRPLVQTFDEETENHAGKLQ